MVALNREQLRKDLHILTKISPFIGQHEREDMNFPSQAKDWKKSETSNKSIALNVLYVLHKKKEIRQVLK